MILWIASSFIAFVVKGLCGFANTLVFTSVMAFGNVSNVVITPVEMLLTLPANLLMAWKQRKHADWKRVIPLCLLVLVGQIPGVLLLKKVDGTIIKIVFGFLILFLGVQMLLTSKKEKKSAIISKPVLAGISLVTGVLMGAYGIGVLLATVLAKITKDTKHFKSIFSTISALESTFRLIMYITTGVLTMQLAKTGLMLLPVMVLGLWIGMKFSDRLNEKTVKTIVQVFLVVSGLMLIITNI